MELNYFTYRIISFPKLESDKRHLLNLYQNYILKIKNWNFDMFKKGVYKVTVNLRTPIIAEVVIIVIFWR